MQNFGVSVGVHMKISTVAVFPCLGVDKKGYICCNDLWASILAQISL